MGRHKYEDEVDDEEEVVDFLRPGRYIHRATNDEGLSEHVLYAAEAPQSYFNWLVWLGTLTCNPCLVANAEQIRQDTYITVYENKLEYSKPCQLYCCTMDRVRVIYLDRMELRKVSKAESCAHGLICPTLGDKFGEGVVLHGADCFSPNQTSVGCTMNHCLFCKPSILLYPLTSADEAMEVITYARDKAMERLKKQRKPKMSQHATSTELTDYIETHRHLRDKDRSKKRGGHNRFFKSEALAPKPDAGMSRT